MINENALAEDFNCVFEMNIVISSYKWHWLTLIGKVKLGFW